ncbi:unnamed protein product [Allacma fusca]|uniref:Uncharacterized protein n=1 Tax=Allacma fusca TaxID=39272 RepID=A0A8J2L6D1_9HEXA|nr:unnamed protein product [Allacma fusca]
MAHQRISSGDFKVFESKLDDKFSVQDSSVVISASYGGICNGALCNRCKVPERVFDLFFWLGYFNSCLNPFIYACTSREFQRAFRRILCRRAPQRPHISRAIYRANVPNRCLDRQCNGNIAMHQLNHQWS